jgi:hypothetical protein
MSDGGKGSKPRPYSVEQKTFDNNWEATFGKRKKTEETPDSIDTKTQDIPVESKK